MPRRDGASLFPSARQRSRPKSARSEQAMCRAKSGTASFGCTSPSPVVPVEGRRSCRRAVAPTLPVFSERYRHYNLTYEAQISEDHAQVSQMDPAHGPFVHRRWWWVARHLFGQQPRGRYALSPPAWLARTHVFAIETPLVQRFVGAKTGLSKRSSSFPTSARATISVWSVLDHRTGHRNRLTPTTRRFDQRWAWNAFYFLPFLATMLRLYFYWFFGPDRRILPKAGRGPRSHPAHDADGRRRMATRSGIIESARIRRRRSNGHRVRKSAAETDDA